MFAATGGAKSCQGCPPGQFAKSGRSSCASCPAGLFAQAPTTDEEVETELDTEDRRLQAADAAATLSGSELEEEKSPEEGGEPTEEAVAAIEEDEGSATLLSEGELEPEDFEFDEETSSGDAMLQESMEPAEALLVSNSE